MSEKGDVAQKGPTSQRVLLLHNRMKNYLPYSNVISDRSDPSLYCSLFGCPYSIMNMNKECSLSDRLGTSSLGRAESVDGRTYKGDYTPSPDK